MTRRRGTALVLAIVCVAAWWVAAARVRAPQAPPLAEHRAPDQPAPAALFDFEAQRLRLEPSTVPAVRSRRDPFTFAEPERRPSETSVPRDDRGGGRPTATALPTDVPDPFPFTLVGVVTRRGDDATSRVAVFAGRGQLILAAQGETVASRYVVDTVGADAVGLRDASTGRVVRLALR